MSNIGKVSPRQYVGGDVQVKLKHNTGFAELRAEYITGRQTGAAFSSETPNALLTGNDGFHVRRFNGAYFYLISHIFSTQHQVILKYDWYDPNFDVSGKDIGLPGTNLGAVNIRYNTLGMGYMYHISSHAKVLFYYTRLIMKTPSWRALQKTFLMTFSPAACNSGSKLAW